MEIRPGSSCPYLNAKENIQYTNKQDILQIKLNIHLVKCRMRFRENQDYIGKLQLILVLSTQISVDLISAIHLNVNRQKNYNSHHVLWTVQTESDSHTWSQTDHAPQLSAPLVEREHPESVTETALVHICTLVGVNIYNKLSM